MASRTSLPVLLLASGLVGFLTPRVATAAPQTIIQTSLKGGIATDGTGVATPRQGGSTQNDAPPASASTFYDAWRPVELRMPATATITKAYLAVHGGFGGIPTDVPAKVRFAGKSLAEAGAPVVSNSVVAVYDVTTGFGVTPGTTQYMVQERGDADPAYNGSGLRIGGEQLVVFYEDAAAPLRQVSWFVNDALGDSAGTTTTFGGLVSCGQGTRTVTTSFGIIWETEAEQNSAVYLKQGAAPEQLLSSTLGGCDDGQPAATGGWRALFTVGSFGADSSGALVGVSGDNFLPEPRADGTASNSRQSDELFSISGPATASTWTIRFAGDGDSKLTSLITVIEQDD
ncbi:MAG: hypothetical protein EOO75_19525, partial [Myxococcales bacterium]